MGEKVLLVEDDLLAAAAYARSLQQAGYQVECALDGEEALAKCNDGVNCMILDLVLPKKDGWQVLSELKANKNTRHIPVVIFTVLDGSDHRKLAQKLGAAYFVNKFKDEIVPVIEKVLRAQNSGSS